ncbi:HSP20-like chaperone [Blyttiomyces helicus]|uniref:HSP20-like chaperone n=1 Tax=Blyttiomyces helicus TaxID=388810 RepID=A0A4P9W9W4_9FUNG|nr:HSP20-like chaperone [Blyttiomyces helicus]|eukprot:RKO87016.1 HSP20-like chaperone [Blyttiomyces helicus]
MSILAFSDVFDHPAFNVYQASRQPESGTAADQRGDKKEQLAQRQSVWDALRRGPQIDVVETEQEYIVKADLPGLKKDEVNISMQDGVLSISGDRKAEKVESTDQRHVVERYHGRFQRQIHIPVDVIVAKASAKMENGVLELKLPKDLKKIAPAKIPIA